MADIFDYPVFAEMPFLRELAEDLEGTFHVIAHAGHETNLPYIRKSQKYFRNKYGKFIKHIESDVGSFHIIPAYDVLQELLDGNSTPEDIMQRCEECLEEKIMGGEPSDVYVNTFQEFYRQNAGI